METQPTVYTAIFQNKFPFSYIRLNICILKTKFTSHKQYLLGLLFSRNAKKTHTDQSMLQAFLACLKRNISQTFEISSCKKSFRSVYYCVKSVRIRSYSGLCIPAFGLNTERYGVRSVFNLNVGKIRTRLTPNMDTFYAVYITDTTFFEERERNTKKLVFQKNR